MSREHQKIVESLPFMPEEATGWEYCPWKVCSPSGLLQMCKNAEEREIALPSVQETDSDGDQNLCGVAGLL